MAKKAQKKSRKSVVRKPKPRPRTRARARVRPPLAFDKRSLTIQFENEHDLREKLRQVLSLFDEQTGARAVTRGTRAVAVDAAAGPCIPLLTATAIVVEALAPKAFSPPEKLGTTYLIPQERELFRQRVVDGVGDRGCQIDSTDVPSDEAATHGGVVSAVRQNAH
jgi:hypothetical protein